MGWSEGKGLGRQEDGISSALVVKKKDDAAGVTCNSPFHRCMRQSTLRMLHYSIRNACAGGRQCRQGGAVGEPMVGGCLRLRCRQAATGMTLRFQRRCPRAIVILTTMGFQPAQSRQANASLSGQETLRRMRTRLTAASRRTRRPPCPRRSGSGCTATAPPARRRRRRRRSRRRWRRTAGAASAGGTARWPASAPRNGSPPQQQRRRRRRQQHLPQLQAMRGLHYHQQTLQTFP